MAVLPSADTAIQIDDNQPRRQGIGAWNPGIIGAASREESSGLERLGNSISSVTSEIGDQASQVQYSQAIGQANADLTVAHGKLPGTTDPSQVLSADQNTPAPSFQELGAKINAARSMISSPKLQAQFDATMAPHIANFGVQSQARGRELNNQNGVASLETNTTTVISNAAALDDEGAATRALDGVQAQIAPLVSSGAMTPEQAVTFRKGVAEQFVTARHDYLLAQVEAQPPGQRDYSKLNAFSAAHGLGPIDDSTIGTAVGTPAAGQPPIGSAAPAVPPARPSASPPDVYANIPDVDKQGRPGQIAKFQQWNPDPIGNSAKILSTVHPDLQAIVQKAQQDNPNLPFVVALGKTTPEQGQLAQSWGWSQTGANSEHNKGTVVDLWPVDGQNRVDFDAGKQRQINTAMQKAAGELGLNLRWGGLGSEGGQNKSFRDAPNFQLLNPKPWDSSTAPPVPPAQPATTPISFTPPPATGLTVAPQFAPMIQSAAAKWGVDPSLLIRQLHQESPKGLASGQFEQSGAGAQGLGQFIPGTAARYGVNVHDPQSSIEGAAHYMSDLQNMFGGNKGLALAGYNWGEGNVQRWLRNGADPSKLPAETAGYVRSITGHNLSDWVQNPGISIHTVPLAPGQVNPTNTTPPGPANFNAPIIVNNFGDGGAPASTQVASLGPVGLPVGPINVGMLGPGVTVDDASASAGTRAPPQSQWPAGATGVMTNADGTISYKMGDGSQQPVPGSRATGSPHSQLTPPPQGSILSLLPPDRRAAMQLRTVQEIRRMQREDATFNQKDDRGDLASIGNAVKQIESGVPMGDQAWAPIRNAYSGPDASPQVKYAFAVADATRNTINAFQGASPAAVATAIDNMRSQYAAQVNNPATAAQSGVLKAVIDSSQNYLKAYEQGVNKNPIGRAAMEGVIGGSGDAPVKTLDPTSPTFGQDVLDRVHQAQVAAKMFGQSVPTYLQPEERQALRKVAQSGGEPMVNLAKGIAGAGPDAYEMFKQIGKGAPQLAQIGQWALDPNADHSDQIRRYADQIQIMNNPDLAKHSPQITDNDMRKSTMGVNPLGDAASAFPLTDTARMDQTANVLASEAAANAHIDPKAATFGGTAIPPEMIPNSYHEAVGGTKDPKTGVWFGGLAKVGGSSWRGVAGGYNAIVPTNMRQDQFETALGQVNQSDVDKMGPPPFGGSGKLSAEDIKKGQFVAVPDKATGLFGGRYQVKLPDPTQNNTMQPVRDSSGKPWIFDMNRAQTNGLDQRVPGAFKGQWHSGGTPSGPVIPAPHGSYQNVKGVDLSPDVASSEAPSEE